MAANPGLDLDTLTRVLAQPKLAGAGQAKGGHPFMSALGYIGAAMRGVAQAPQGSPAILGALAPVMELYNLRQYNKGMAEQAAAERMQQKMQREGERNDRVGFGQQAGLNNYSGYADLPDAATLANIQSQNWNNNPAGLESFLQNGELLPVQGAAVPEKVLMSVIDRANAANDANATLSKLPAFMSAAIPGAQNPNNAPTLPPVKPGQTTTPTPTLQASASQQEMVTPGNAMQYGIPDVSQLLTGRANEQDDRLGNRKASETERSNKVEEGLRKLLYASQQANNYASANLKQRTNPNLRSGGGGSDDPYKVPKSLADLQDKLTGQVRNQVKDIDSELKALGYVGEGGRLKTPDMTTSSGFFGMGGHRPSANDIRANQLLQQRQELQSSLIGGGAPFGGGSRQRLQNAGANASASGFSAWKQSRR
jgi:hypothetical protein